MQSDSDSLTSSFSAQRIGGSTFLVIEDDDLCERPFIYVRTYPQIPLVLLSDTGTDEPSKSKTRARFTKLRDFLENYPVADNGNQPLNPTGSAQYVIICTHCHYDHIGGIAQFLSGDRTDIIASAAGRDFIESDLYNHGLFKFARKPPPDYVVTGWAQAFDRLYHDPRDRSTKPARHASEDPALIDLGITIVHTPGHTPDQLAWYDHDEMHLYVGDTLYEAGDEGAPVIWPVDGNMIEWMFSTRKLQAFVQAENAQARRALQAEGSGSEVGATVARRVTLGAGHVTHTVDAEEVLGKLDEVWWRVMRGEVEIIKAGDEFYTGIDPRGDKLAMCFKGPLKLLEEARKFFMVTPQVKGE